jgi:hypothetical protein
MISRLSATTNIPSGFATDVTSASEFKTVRIENVEDGGVAGLHIPYAGSEVEDDEAGEVEVVVEFLLVPVEGMLDALLEIPQIWRERRSGYDAIGGRECASLSHYRSGYEREKEGIAEGWTYASLLFLSPRSEHLLEDWNLPLIYKSPS